MKHYPLRMSFKHTIFAILLGFSLIKPVAAEITSGPISLDQCVLTALENNIDIRISYFGPRISNLDYNADQGSYYDPQLSLSSDISHNTRKKNADPTQFRVGNTSDSFRNNLGLRGNITPFLTALSLSVSGDGRDGLADNPLGGQSPFSSSGGNATLSLDQPLLRNGWGGRIVQIKLGKNAIKTSIEALSEQIISTVTTVKKAYYTLIASRENLVVAKETLSLTEQNYANQKRRAEVGTIAQSQLPQLQAELLSQKAALLSAQNTHKTNINNLKKLLSDDFASIQDIDLIPIGDLNPIKTVFNRADSWDKALKNRPDIKRLRITLENNNINLKFSKSRLWPQLDFNAYYNLRGDDQAPRVVDENGNIILSRDAEFSRSFREIRDRNNPNYGARVTLRFPLGNRQAKASYERQKILKEEALLRYKNVEQSIMIEIDRFIRDAEYRFEQIEVRKQSRISSELALKNDTKRYDEGAIDNYQVLQSQRDLTDRRYAEINANLEYLKALTDLAQAEGSTLINNNINIQIDQ